MMDSTSASLHLITAAGVGLTSASAGILLKAKWDNELVVKATNLSYVITRDGIALAGSSVVRMSTSLGTAL